MPLCTGDGTDPALVPLSVAVLVVGDGVSSVEC